MRTSGVRMLGWLSDRAAELLYPTATYCIVCGNFIDGSREYCICDHCIRHIEWGKIRVDVKRQAEAERKSENESKIKNESKSENARESERESESEANDGNVPSFWEGTAAKAYNETQLAELQAAYRSAAWELPDSVSACFEYGLYSRRVVFELKYNGHSYVARVGAHIMADRVCTDPAAAALHSCDFVTAVPISRRKMQQRGFNQAEKLAKYFCRETAMPHLPDILMRAKDTEALRSLSPAERSLNLQDAFLLNERKLWQLRRVKAESDSLTEQEKAESTAACRMFESGCTETCVPHKAVKSGSGDAHIATNLPSEKKEAAARHLRSKQESREGEASKSLPLEGMRILLIDDIYTTGATAKQCTQVLKAAGASEVHLLVLATGSDFAVNEK